MNRMVSLARIMFAGIGIFLSITICGSIIQSVIFAFDNPNVETVTTVAFSLLVSLAMLAAVILALFVKGDYFARKLFTGDIDEDRPMNIDLTLEMAFRLVCVGVGLLCLRTFVFRLTNIFAQIIMWMEHSDTAVRNNWFLFAGFSRVSASSFIQLLLLLALTVYLLLGAPHFVRWQVKKTLKFCG